MNIVLFEDNQCDQLRPIGLFRPLCEVYAGSLTLMHVTGTLGMPVTCLRREHFFPNDVMPDVLPGGDGPTLFLNASIEPDIRYREKISDLLKAGDPFLTTSGNRVSAALLPAGKTLGNDVSWRNISARLLEQGLPLEDEFFRTIDWPHMAVDAHLRLFPSNLQYIISSGKYREKERNVFLGEDVNLASTAAFDGEKGPVVIDDHVKVMHFTYLEGPIHIGAGTKVIEHSSIKDFTSIGSICKIGGEIEASQIEPYSNKQHHGFLGHSWLGRWVNLGAGTSTSDLKNTYGKVRVYYRGARVETGMQFLGSIIGDFCKSAVNTSFFTGKIVGVSCMLYGTVTTNVPCFTNYARSFGQVTEISLDQVITTQKRMFARRGVQQSHYDIELTRRVFDMTRDERVMSEEPINF
jgi:glucose-1-phosphate thymidylyltransferase